jgi:hypothetical protein
MSRLLDFNLSTPRSRTTSSQESSIVIHNTVKNTPAKRDSVSFPQQISYPTLDAPSVSPIIEREVDIEDVAELKSQLCFYQELAHVFSNILKSNNMKLITNLLDQSGKIILDAESLCTLIGLITNESPATVNIQYEDNKEGCLAKMNLIHKIKTIKIGVIDFNLGFNAQFNTLQEKYAVSLKRVVVFTE